MFTKEFLEEEDWCNWIVSKIENKYWHLHSIIALSTTETEYMTITKFLRKQFGCMVWWKVWELLKNTLRYFVIAKALFIWQRIKFIMPENQAYWCLISLHLRNYQWMWYSIIEDCDCRKSCRYVKESGYSR